MAKKFIPLELDRTRNLRYGMVALTRLEKKLGKPFAKIDFENEMTYSEVADILWAGMVHEDADLTPEKVAELIDDYSDIPTALAVMGEAMHEAFGGKNAQRTAMQNEENGTGTQL
ncbi:MAG: hypothetical protein ACYDEJ_03205 [Desulfitobacteriaceae bacterium]